MILYQGGNAGTWLTWLINQHSDFPKFIKQDNIRKNIKKSRDISCPGADWHLEDLIIYSGEEQIFRNEISWEEYEKHANRHAVNLNYSKIAFKIIPNHDARLGNIELDKKLLKRIFHQTSCKIILCSVSDVFNAEISNRWNILRKEKETIGQIKNSLTLDRRTINFKTDDYKDYATDIYSTDIGSLILGDKTEYENLCNFINQPPLENFKELADDYRLKYFT